MCICTKISRKFNIDLISLGLMILLKGVQKHHVRASPAVLSIWHSAQKKLDEEKSKICPFGSGIWFWLNIIAPFVMMAGTR